MRLSTLIDDTKDSIRGVEFDYTKIHLNRAIYLISIPMILEMVMESIFAVVDIYFVNRLGPEAVATVGITESVITLVYAISIGLSTATTAMVARRIGEKNKKLASITAFQAILTAAVVSLLIALPGILFSKQLLELMGAEPYIINELSAYTTIMLGGNVVIMLLFIINAIFRSSGDPAISMYVLVLANVLNIILDPILIFGWGPFPAMGIKGAAIATNTGRGIAVALQLYLLIKGRGRIKLNASSISWRFDIIKQLVRLSLGGIGQYVIGTSSWIILMRIMAEFGSNVLAGYTIAIRIIVFALLPAWGLSNAAATLVGQNLGAGQADRAERAVWVISRINMLVMGLLGLIMLFFPVFFLSVFTDVASVVAAGVEGLKILGAGFFIYGLGMVLMNALNGAGDTLTPTWINLFSFWLLEVPLAYYLAIIWGWESEGVFYSIIIAESLLTLQAWWVFRKGKWKLQKV